MATMDSREIGQLFLVGFYGTQFTPEVRDFLDELNPCGVILFSRNIEDPIQVANLNRDLQLNALARNCRGLFIGVDQEGGRVRRLRGPFTSVPPALELAGSQGSSSLIRELAEITARELRLVGFNLNFVPVLDVPAEGENLSRSVIGDRAYGFDPETVAALGLIVIDAMRSQGVIPCCKHFPGHGGTAVDSHTDLPVDARTAEALEACDLVPFRRAIENAVEMTMTAHVVYPAWDPTLPATLSPRIVEGMLRKSWGFDGVVVTDDLDMAAVSEHHTAEDCAVLAVSAGVDVMLICNKPEKALSARNALFEAVRSGEISWERVGQSLERIRRLKALYEASMAPCEEPQVKRYFANKSEKEIIAS